MNRSVGVTVIAILVLIGSALVLGMGALVLIGALAGSAGPAPNNFPGSPMFFRTFILMIPLIYILPAIWGIVTGVGLLQLKNWARISIIVFSVLLLLVGLGAGLGSSIFFLTSPPPTLDRQAVAFVRVFMVLVAAMQIGLGSWWLVFFNRVRVKEQFVARPMFDGYPAQAGYPAPASYHVQPPPGVSVPIAPGVPRRPLSLSIIAWIMLVISVFFPVNVALRTPAILVVKVLTGWQATVVMSLYEVLIIFIGIGLLRLKPAARYAGISYFVFSVLNIVVFNFAPGGQARVMKLLETQRSTFPWMRDTPNMSQQLNPTAFFLMVSVMTLVFSLVPLYFLIKEKQAFEKAAAHVA